MVSLKLAYILLVLAALKYSFHYDMKIKIKEKPLMQ